MARLGRMWLTAIALLGAGCAPLTAQHEADAAFRKALAAQLASQEDVAERLYEQVLRLGVRTSAVYNNLAVIAAHKHAYSSSRRLFASAVVLDDRDVVAMTNYAVMSYCLYDFKEARRAFAEATTTRQRILDRIPSLLHDEWRRAQYEQATEPLVRVAEKYLARIDRAEVGGEAPSVGSDTVASLTVASVL